MSSLLVSSNQKTSLKPVIFFHKLIFIPLFNLCEILITFSSDKNKGRKVKLFMGL